MASPQIENGFVMIALDLFAAIMAADLRNRDKVVLAEVLLQTYGPLKRRSVHLDHVTLEHYTGIHRNNARAGIKSLVQGKLLILQPDGSYRFNKDYESWDMGGQTFAVRLGGSLLRFIQSAVSRFGKSIKTSRSFPIQGDTTSTITPIQVRRGNPPKPNLPESGPTNVPQSEQIGANPDQFAGERDVSLALEQVNNPSLACAGAPASEELRSEKDKRCSPSESKRAASGLEASPGREPSEPEPFDVGVEDHPSSVHAAGPGMDSAEAIALEEWANRFGSDPRGASYGFWAREQCELSPAAWVRAVLEAKVVGVARRPSVFVLTRIMADCRAEGSCEYHARSGGDRARRNGRPRAADATSEDWQELADHLFGQGGSS